MNYHNITIQIPCQLQLWVYEYEGDEDYEQFMMEQVIKIIRQKIKESEDDGYIEYEEHKRRIEVAWSMILI